jgi:hypothetical protein
MLSENRLLDIISKKRDTSELDALAHNNRANPTIVAACNRQSLLLKSKYLGDFETELSAYLAIQPDRMIHLVLPLANDKKGNSRPDVTVDVVLNSLDRINILDTTKGTNTLHTSLSSVRGKYGKFGGGSNTWLTFCDPTTRQPIAELIGVDPALATKTLS